MSELKIVVTGASGRMGRTLIREIAQGSVLGVVLHEPLWGELLFDGVGELLLDVRGHCGSVTMQCLEAVMVIAWPASGCAIAWD